MSDELKKKFDEVINSIKKDLDSIAKRIDEYLDKGEFYKAYRAWRDAVLNSMRALRKALDSISEELKEVKLSEEELRKFTNHIRDGVRDVVSRIEEIGSKIKEFRGGRYVWVWFGPRPFRHVFHEIVEGVNITIDGILGSIERFVENLEKTFEDVEKKVTQVVSVRIKEKELEVIDRLVDAGIFKSRSEAVAFFTRKGIECNRDWIEKALEQAKRIKELQESIRKEIEGEEEKE